MAQSSNQPDKLFQESDTIWELERLYEDLRSAKRGSNPDRKQVLTPIEKCYVRGLLLGQDPRQIAQSRGCQVGTVEDALSKGVYRYIEELIRTQTGKSIHVRWDNIAFELERAGYKSKPRESLVSQHSKTCYEDIPYIGADKFFGREQELKKLDALLQECKQRVIACVFGMPGVGKTELAIQYARHHLKQLKDSLGGVCWLDAREGNIGEQILRFARSHNLNPPENSDQLSYCWNNWFGGNWLIIIDDVTNANYNQHIQPYLPPSILAFRILLTSQVEIGPSIESLELKELLPEAAEQLLRSLIKSNDRIDQEVKVAQEICREVGYLPLAVELLGRYLYRDPGLSLKTVLSLLKKQRLKLKAIHEIDKHSPMTGRYGVEAAFNLLWEVLDNNTRQLGCLLSLFSLSPIPWMLVESILPEGEELLLELRFNLIRYSLLRFTNKNCYQLHQLIRDFFQDRLKIVGSEECFKKLFAMTIADYSRDLPTPELPHKDLVVMNASIVPHVEECIQYLEEFNLTEGLFNAHLFLGKFYQSMENFDHTEKWCKRCLDISNRFFGNSHSHTAVSSNNLGMFYYDRGCYQEAENYVIQALSFWKGVMKRYPELFKRDPQNSRPLDEIVLLMEVQQTLLNLSSIQVALEQYSKAVRSLKRGLKINKALIAKNDYFYLAKVHQSLGNILCKQGSYCESEEELEKALKFMKLASVPSFTSAEASDSNRFSIIWSEEDANIQTFQVLPQIQQTYENLQEEQLAYSAFIERDLGMLYYFWEKYDKARDYLEQALNTVEHLLIAEHPAIAVIQNNLANVYVKIGHYKEAEEIYKKALQSDEKRFGIDSPETLMVRNNLEYLRSNLNTDHQRI